MAILAEKGITITVDQIVIVSLKDGSVFVEFGITGPDGPAAIQALLDIWNLETTDILPVSIFLFRCSLLLFVFFPFFLFFLIYI